HDRVLDQVELRFEAQVFERLVDGFGDVVGRGRGVADDLQRFRAGVLAARVTGELHVLFRDLHVAFAVFVVVHLRTGEATRFFEAGDAVPEEVRHQIGDGLATTQPVQGFAVGRRPQ